MHPSATDIDAIHRQGHRCLCFWKRTSRMARGSNFSIKDLLCCCWDLLIPPESHYSIGIHRRRTKTLDVCSLRRHQCPFRLPKDYRSESDGAWAWKWCCVATSMRETYVGAYELIRVHRLGGIRDSTAALENPPTCLICFSFLQLPLIFFSNSLLDSLIF